MKTCTNGLPCPTALHCSMGCFFTEAETPHYRAMNAPLHSKNGGNQIDHGEALAKIERAETKRIRWGLSACAVLWLAAFVLIFYRGLS